MRADLAWIVPAALGALGLASVVVWRLFGRWRRRRRLRIQTRRLGSFDPTERVRGALAVIDLGLTRRSAGALLDHVAHEEDERVRLALARAVAAGREALSRRRRVRKLRTWAADELAAQGHGATPLPDGKRAGRKKRKKDQSRISWRAPAAQS